MLAPRAVGLHLARGRVAVGHRTRLPAAARALPPVVRGVRALDRRGLLSPRLDHHDTR